MGVPYTFGTATTSIPLSNLDANFNTPVTIGSTTVGLGNTVTTVANLTLTNATISSGNVTVTTGIFGAGSNTAPSITFTGDTNTGIYSPAADTIAFTEGGVESMRIDSSGNVGIGNTPSGTSATGYRSLELGTTAGTGITAGNGDFYIPVNAYVAGGAWKYATTSTASLLNIQGGLFTWSNAVSGTAGNNISFSERMRITSTGIVGIGTSSPSGKLQVKANTNISLYVGNSGLGSMEVGNYDVTDGYNPLLVDGSYVAFATGTAGGQSVTERMRIDSSGTLFIGATSSPSGTQRLVLTANGSAGIEPMLFNELRATSATENYVRFYRNGSQVGSITNTLSATAYVTSSDYRLKDNVAPMTGALAKVAQLKPVTYTWKATGETSQGFIAHELQAVVPECVSGEKDAVDKNGKPKYQGIDTSFLVATLTAALQELKAELDSIKAELQTLKGN